MAGDSSGAEVEWALWCRHQAGDETAMWELIERQRPMAEGTIGKWCEPGSALYEEACSLLTEWLVSAYNTWKPTAPDSPINSQTYSTWATNYVRGYMKRLAPRRKQDKYAKPLDAGLEATEAKSHGRIDGHTMYNGDSGLPIPEDDLPTFLNKDTNRLIGLLVKGHTHKEARAMLGVSQAEYQRKLDLIRGRLDGS